MSGVFDLLAAHLRAVARPLIVVLGPTASGKTAFSIDLCRHIPQGAEVINADSRQLYRGLDIGTAKVTAEEAQGVPHHLIGVRDPREPVTVAWYRDAAMHMIDAVLARGKVPVLVGGSMLYISAIIDGLQPLDSADPGLRRSLEERCSKGESMALYEQLKQLDPDAAAGIDPRNHVYLVRALEICLSSGEPVSAQRRTGDCPYDLLVFGLRWPREELTKRIDARTRQMLEAGWIEEVQRLLAAGVSPDAPAMISHGYREIAVMLTATGKADRDLLFEQIAPKTRQYAKRQMTWWRHDGRIRWIDCGK